MTVYEFRNFAVAYGSSPHWSGANVPSTVRGLIGAGPTTSIVRMVPNTSTRSAPSGPTFSATNELYLLAIMNPYSGFRLEGIQFQATAQGHIYNGVRVQNYGAFTIKNVRVVGVPGNAGAPPGETFGFNMFRQQAGTTANVDDLYMDGKGVGAAGLGLNKVLGTINVRRCTAINHAYSCGIAPWQIGGTINVYDSVLRNNKRNFGAECLRGTINIYDPVWGDPIPTKYDVNLTYGISSGQTWKNGKVNFYFSDSAAWQAFIGPRVVKKIKVVTNPKQDYGQGVMPDGTYNDLWNAVSVYVGGVKQRSSDYVAFAGRRI